MLTYKNPKAKSCVVCERVFVPERMGQVVCRPACAGKKARQEREAIAKAERESIKRRKEAIKTIPDLIKEAQHAFNAYIRARDSSLPCVCCGKPLGHSDVGGGFDCGHYRSVGSASHLRFDERNAHAQRKQCNRYGAGRAVDYRIGLVARIGLAAVESLESDNTPHKWTREELIAIRNFYRGRLKEIRSNKYVL